MRVIFGLAAFLALSSQAAPREIIVAKANVHVPTAWVWYETRWMKALEGSENVRQLEIRAKGTYCRAYLGEVFYTSRFGGPVQRAEPVGHGLANFRLPTPGIREIAFSFHVRDYNRVDCQFTVYGDSSSEPEPPPVEPTGLDLEKAGHSAKLMALDTRLLYWSFREFPAYEPLLTPLKEVERTVDSLKQAIDDGRKEAEIRRRFSELRRYFLLLQRQFETVHQTAMNAKVEKSWRDAVKTWDELEALFR